MFVVDQRATAKLTAVIKHDGCPWPLIRVCILTANNSFLILEISNCKHLNKSQLKPYLESIFSSATSAIEIDITDDWCLCRWYKTWSFCGSLCWRPNSSDRGSRCPSCGRSFRSCWIERSFSRTRKRIEQRSRVSRRCVVWWVSWDRRWPVAKIDKIVVVWNHWKINFVVFGAFDFWWG